ncbi:MAG: DUF5985 family protein [Stellaceae bacterium]
MTMGYYFGADFVSGVICAGYLILGLFFLRFWRRTSDSLFVAFGIAFWLLAINHASATLTHVEETTAAWLYFLRLAAFAIISVAILLKNRRATD